MIEVNLVTDTVVLADNTWLRLHWTWCWWASIFYFPQDGGEIFNTGMNSESKARCFIKPQPYTQNRLKKGKTKEKMPGLWISLIAFIYLSYFYKCKFLKNSWSLKNWGFSWQLSSHCKWQWIRLQPRRTCSPENLSSKSCRSVPPAGADIRLSLEVCFPALPQFMSLEAELVEEDMYWTATQAYSSKAGVGTEFVFAKDFPRFGSSFC